VAQNWREDGEEPDYRFSLANERTFLAWVRTGLALVAAAVVVHQLGTGLAPAWATTTVGLGLTAAAAYVLVSGYGRWRRNQQAMRSSRPLPQSRAMEVLTVLFVAVAALAAVLVLAG
jgi:putative membrane protein